MKRLKMFLEFVIGDKKSVYLDGTTYEEIARMLGTEVDEVEEFEAWLGDKINPGKTFHGSFDPNPHDENDYAQTEMFDNVETEEQYMAAYKIYSQEEHSHSSHSHDDLGL
jgi:hypothetical protein